MQTGKMETRVLMMETRVLMGSQEQARDLIERAKTGDRPAFEALAEMFRPRLEKLIEARLGKRLRESLEADDVLQESMLRAFRSIQDFEWRKEDAFFSWLSGIVEHVLQTAVEEQARRRFVRLESDVAGSQVPPSRALGREERFDRLEEALKDLSPEHRQVILLARAEGLSIKDIAIRMDRSPDAVKQLLSRALRKLRTTFGKTDSLHLPPERTLGSGGEGMRDDHEG
jgi:RNA polymerase sigma-70 factor (subfamily 1)